MGLDFSGIDAELAALGPELRDLDTLSRQQASALGTLSAVDASLAELAAGVDQPATPDRRSRSSNGTSASDRRPKSGEIALGEPVQRRTDPASTELTLLESDRPSSGSFELASAAPDANDGGELDVFASPKRAIQAPVTPISLSPAGSRPPAIELTPIATDPFRDSGDDDALFSQEQPEPDTLVIAEDRDADAEFDALFDEATHPSGIPARSYDLDEETLSAEDLLSGLSAPPPRESDAATNALFAEFDASDNTDIIDSKTLDAHLDPFPSEEELGSSEFEIVLDEEGTARDIVRSQPPDALTPSGGEKRPSFLGRLFGRKDEKP